MPDYAIFSLDVNGNVATWNAGAELIKGYRSEEVIGKELVALQEVLKSGITSVEQANLAAAKSLSVVDQVVPELAWEHLRSQLPRARGDWGA